MFKYRILYVCFRVYSTNTLFLKLVIQKVKYFTSKWKVITTGTLQKWPQEKPEIVSFCWLCYLESTKFLLLLSSTNLKLEIQVP